MTDDKGKSLADQLKAKKEAEEAAKAPPQQSLADKLTAQKQAAVQAQTAKEPQSLADQLKAKKEAEEAAKAPSQQSLADKLTAQKQAAAQAQTAKEAQKEPQSLGDKLAGQKEAVTSTAAKIGAAGFAAAATSAALSEEAAAELDAQITKLKADYRKLLERVKLTSIVRDTTTLGNQVRGLPSAIEQVRGRGYAFRSYLEHKANVLAEQWNEIDSEIKRWIETEASTLEADLRNNEPLLQQIDKIPKGTVTQQQLAGQLAGVLDLLGSKVEAAEKHIQTMYDELRREASITDSQLKEIAWFLDEKDAASFKLMPGESLFMVAKAEWDENNKKPNGLLFLTDQRLIFEQKEKVGKRLGLFGGQDVQNVLWEAPVSAVENVKPENKGLFGGKDMLHLMLGHGAPYPAITVEVKGGVDCKLWAKQINRMVSGDAHDERAIQPDPELIEALRNAPTQCHVCGGTLPQVMRGQLEITCRYCSTVIRL